MSFWEKLPRPFFALAPLADVTDAAFRRLVAKYSAHERADGSVGGPDVMWTEFVSADGLARAPEAGRRKLLADLLYTEAERPIVAQLFSSDEGVMEYAAALCRELKFDGVDINMGCPDRSIEKQGCGAAMIKNPRRAQAVIRAAKRGAKSGAPDGLPVSVKTRLGYHKDELEAWLPALLEEEPAAVTLHARTRQEMSRVSARWGRVAEAVSLRDRLGSQALIIGNGDVLSLEDARVKAAASGADGVMVGRAIFGNPWFFHPTRRLPFSLTALPTHGIERDSIVREAAAGGASLVSLSERLSALVEHSRLFAELLPHKSFAIMKKHFKAYASGLAGAAALRARLMEAESPDEVEAIVRTFSREAVARRK
jgi:tRNA-dihydrouridine synthase